MTRATRSALVALALCGTSLAPAWAGGLRELDQTIFGMDCAPCAAGVEAGLRKLHGVRSVRVSLNEGKAVVTLTPESQTTVAQIREVVLHNGFTPKEARATLVGRVTSEGDRLWIEMGSERFILEGDRTMLQSRAIAKGTDQELTLSVHIPETLQSPPAVQLIAPGQSG
ncbi:MAG: heavy-metal-associated domain-containing protein [Steroidobacteraceae bacterium]